MALSVADWLEIADLIARAARSQASPAWVWGPGSCNLGRLIGIEPSADDSRVRDTVAPCRTLRAAGRVFRRCLTGPESEQRSTGSSMRLRTV
jgi:hypothetical protein